MKTDASRTFTPEDLARRWRCNPKTVANRAARGDIPCFRVGRLLRFTEEAVAQFEQRATESRETR